MALRDRAVELLGRALTNVGDGLKADAWPSDLLGFPSASVGPGRTPVASAHDDALEQLEESREAHGDGTPVADIDPVT
jgi:hypothetical protein